MTSVDHAARTWPEQPYDLATGVTISEGPTNTVPVDDGGAAFGCSDGGSQHGFDVDPTAFRGF